MTRGRRLAEEHRRAERFGTARAIAGALRAAGLIERGERGIELLEEAVSTLDGSPAVLELARARVDLGAPLRASGAPGSSSLAAWERGRSPTTPTTSCGPGASACPTRRCRAWSR